MSMNPDKIIGGEKACSGSDANGVIIDEPSTATSKVVVVVDDEILLNNAIERSTSKYTDENNKVLFFTAREEVLKHFSERKENIVNGNREKVLILLDFIMPNQISIGRFIEEINKYNIDSFIALCSAHDVESETPDGIPFFLKGGGIAKIEEIISAFLDSDDAWHKKLESVIDNKDELIKDCSDLSNETRSHPSEIESAINFIVIDNDEGRVQEMRHRLEDALKDRGSVKIHEYTDREDALKSPALTTGNPIVFSDIGGHVNMPSAIEFINSLREAREDIKIVLYTGKDLENFFEDSDNEILNPESQDSVIKAIIHRDNMMNDLRVILSGCGFDCNKTDKRDSVLPICGGTIRDDEEVTSEHIITPESGLHMPVVTWEDDINGNGKLGERWDFVVGDHNIRLHASSLFIKNIIEEQMFVSGAAPSIYVPGAGEGIELIHMAKIYKKKYPEITLKGNELDPVVDARLAESINRNGLTDQIEIESNKWQNLPNVLNKRFNIIYSSGNDLECLPSREDQIIVINNFYKILKPGGTFVYDIRNIQNVKMHKDEIQGEGIIDFVNRTGVNNRPGYPMYNGPKILTYPLILQDGKVWFNYAFINPRMHAKYGDAILTMLLSDLQYHLDMLNNAGFIVSEIHGDFKRKEIAKGNSTISTASDEIMDCGANFFEIVAKKPEV